MSKKIFVPSSSLLTCLLYQVKPTRWPSSSWRPRCWPRVWTPASWARAAPGCLPPAPAPGQCPPAAPRAPASPSHPTSRVCWAAGRGLVRLRAKARDPWRASSRPRFSRRRSRGTCPPCRPCPPRSRRCSRWRRSSARPPQSECNHGAADSILSEQV